MARPTLVQALKSGVDLFGLFFRRAGFLLFQGFDLKIKIPGGVWVDGDGRVS